MTHWQTINSGFFPNDLEDRDELGDREMQLEPDLRPLSRHRVLLEICCSRLPRLGVASLVATIV